MTPTPILPGSGSRYRALPQVRPLRLLRGWTQEDLAREAGVAKSTIWCLETGHGVQLQTVQRLAAALRVPSQFLRVPLVADGTAPPVATCPLPWLRPLRLARQWTGQTLAYEADVTERTVRRAEAGAPVQPTTIERLAAALKVPARLLAAPASRLLNTRSALVPRLYPQTLSR